MNSDLWQSRTENAAHFIARGEIHLGILGVSACVFLLQYFLYLARQLWTKSENDDEKDPGFRSLLYTNRV